MKSVFSVSKIRIIWTIIKYQKSKNTFTCSDLVDVMEGVHIHLYVPDFGSGTE